MEQIEILNLAKSQLIHEISKWERKQAEYIEKFGHENDCIKKYIENRDQELDVIYELILNERKKRD